MIDETHLSLQFVGNTTHVLVIATTTKNCETQLCFQTDLLTKCHLQTRSFDFVLKACMISSTFIYMYMRKSLKWEWHESAIVDVSGWVSGQKKTCSVKLARRLSHGCWCTACCKMIIHLFLINSWCIQLLQIYDI